MFRTSMVPMDDELRQLAENPTECATSDIDGQHLIDMNDMCCKFCRHPVALIDEFRMRSAGLRTSTAIVEARLLPHG